MEKRPGCVHLICGKIASGKSFYAKGLAEKENAVIVSCDEITLLFPPLGDKHDGVTERLRALLMEKAARIAGCGASVILDWGFWMKGYRQSVTAFFAGRGLPVRWHYIDVSDLALRRHIEERNEAAGNGAYFVDEGLLSKCLSLFEAPEKSEMDEWIVPEA